MVKILSLGYVEETLKARHRSLAAAGFDVTSVDKKHEALRLLLKSQRFDVVVIGHGVPVADRNEVATKARFQQKARTIFLYRRSTTNAELADALVAEDGKPEDLYTAIMRLVDKSARNAAG
jgi:CheY-like chemotaxis protein